VGLVSEQKCTVIRFRCDEDELGRRRDGMVTTNWRYLHEGFAQRFGTAKFLRQRASVELSSMCCVLESGLCFHGTLAESGQSSLGTLATHTEASAAIKSHEDPAKLLGEASYIFASVCIPT
jgi:hypothetical protein